MSRPSQDLTTAELAVLQVLWERGPSTRRQLADVLYPGDAPAGYTTVQKLLERLQAKGHVTEATEREQRTFVAVVDREQLINRRLLELAKTLCDGSVTPLLLNLIRTTPLSEQQLAELQAHLDELRTPEKRQQSRQENGAS